MIEMNGVFLNQNHCATLSVVSEGVVYRTPFRPLDFSHLKWNILLISICR